MPAYKGIDDMDEAFFEAWREERAACAKCVAESETKFLSGPCRHKHVPMRRETLSQEEQQVLAARAAEKERLTRA